MLRSRARGGRRLNDQQKSGRVTLIGCRNARARGERSGDGSDDQTDRLEPAVRRCGCRHVADFSVLAELLFADSVGRRWSSGGRPTLLMVASPVAAAGESSYRVIDITIGKFCSTDSRGAWLSLAQRAAAAY